MEHHTTSRAGNTATTFATCGSEPVATWFCASLMPTYGGRLPVSSAGSRRLRKRGCAPKSLRSPRPPPSLTLPRKGGGNRQRLPRASVIRRSSNEHDQRRILFCLGASDKFGSSVPSRLRGRDREGVVDAACKRRRMRHEHHR